MHQLFLCNAGGYGKTVTALCVAAQMKVKCLLVTHTAVLAKQWRESIIQYCPSAVIGQIVQDKFEVEGCTHVIGSLQTLAKRDYSEQMETAGFGLLCVDEGHHISAVCMSNAVSMVGCRYRLLLSATPQRADGLSPFLTMAFGPTLYEVKRPPSQDLRVYCVHLDDGPIMTMHTRGRNPSVNISGMVNLLTKTSLRAQQRQQVALEWIQMALSAGRQILVIGDRIQLLKNLEEMVRSHCTTGFLIGSAKPAEREAARTANVIFGSYSCCAEGLDIADLDTLLLLTPRSGVNCIEQCVGRLLRSGGSWPLCIDLIDDEPTFLGMSRKRIKLFRKMGAKITHYNERKEVIMEGLPG